MSSMALIGASAAPSVAETGDPSAWRAKADSYSVVATREFIDLDNAGQPVTTTVADYHVDLTVSQTTDLRGLQNLDVSWTGAHPTGGIASDSNDGEKGSQQEYPMVLLQCRGQGAAVRPQTCWTQSGPERFVSDNRISFQPGAWRMDAEATPADRAAVVGVPDPRPADCGTAARSERWVPFDSVDGTTYPGGTNPPGSPICANFAPGSTISDSDSSAMPNNTTYGVTGADGSGNAQFNLYGAADSANLGCSATVKCSLVAIPIVGLSCDAYWTKTAAPAGLTQTAMRNAAPRCETTGDYAAGQPLNVGQAGALAVSGRLWWSASNWKNRIVVPLQFAPGSEACTASGAENPLLVYGSVLMTEISSQWQPTFCSTPGLKPFTHVQTADPAARQLLDAGTVSMAFSSQAPADGFVRPVAQAPVAVTGFAVVFTIDDADGKPATTLRLNARLLAKLLSESYRGRVDRDGSAPYKALAGNPETIVEDPEFQALNPTLPTSVNTTAVNAAASAVALSSDADMTWALSEYINADTEARKWLDGVPDPWGMTVNPWYRGIELPVSNWPLRDQWEVTWPSNLCYTDAPVPYLSLVANPNSLVSNIVTKVRFAIPNDQTVCAKEDLPLQRKLVTPGKLTPGTRFSIGIVPLTAAYRYGLRVASLQTSSSVGVQEKFTSADGRTFATANAAGLKAATALLSPDDSTGNWALDYTALTDGTAPSAYPGTVPVYADVPVSGLDSQTAARAAQLLDYAAGKGQRPGFSNGELPPGALPLDSTSAGAALLAYTKCVSTQVRSQSGTVPGLTSACPTSTDPAPPDPTPDPTPDPDPDPAPPVPSAPGVDTVVPNDDTSTPDTPADHTTSDPVTTQYRTVGQASPLGRIALPFALIAGIALLAVGILGRWGPQLRGAAMVAGRQVGATATAVIRRGEK